MADQSTLSERLRTLRDEPSLKRYFMPHERQMLAKAADHIDSLTKRVMELEADGARLLGLASQAQHNKTATERLLVVARAALEPMEDEPPAGAGLMHPASNDPAE